MFLVDPRNEENRGCTGRLKGGLAHGLPIRWRFPLLRLVSGVDPDANGAVVVIDVDQQGVATSTQRPDRH